MPDITGDKSAPVKKQFNPRPQESAKAMISVVFVGYRSPFKSDKSKFTIKLSAYMYMGR